MLSLTNLAWRTGAAAPRRNLALHATDATQYPTLLAQVSPALGINALGRFPGHAIVSDGARFHRVSCALINADQGERLCVTLFARSGTSGQLRLFMRDMATGAIQSLSGPIDALPANVQGIECLSNDVQGDGVTRRIVFRLTSPDTTEIDIALGPFSNVAGEDVTFLGVQVERGDAPTSFQA